MTPPKKPAAKKPAAAKKPPIKKPPAKAIVKTVEVPVEVIKEVEVPRELAPTEIHPKVEAFSAGAVGGAVAGFAWNYFTGSDLPPEVISAISIVIGFVAGYFKKSSSGVTS